MANEKIHKLFSDFVFSGFRKASFSEFLLQEDFELAYGILNIW